MVLPDNSIATPGWTRVDLGLRQAQRLGATNLVWRLGVDNVFDHRAWKEAPYQYGHAYLYPLAPPDLACFREHCVVGAVEVRESSGYTHGLIPR